VTRNPVRILIADDHELARLGLESVLSTADWLEVVGGVGDCSSALEAVRRLRPDVLLLDIRMPGADGLVCLPQIKLTMPQIAVIIVTFYDDRRYILEAIRQGAAGYLLKDASATEILETIRRVVEGQLAIDPQLLREALAAPPEVVPEVESAASIADSYALTPRERDVLALVAEGLTNKEIGGRLSIAEDTVKKHVQNLIWKLRAADRTQAAIIALRVGLLSQDH
jgi:DNA-binding NarL/FixJ family response regulator